MIRTKVVVNREKDDKAGFAFQLFSQMPAARHFAPFKGSTYNKMKILPLKPCYFDDTISNLFLFKNLTGEGSI